MDDTNTYSGPENNYATSQSKNIFVLVLALLTLGCLGYVLYLVILQGSGVAPAGPAEISIELSAYDQAIARLQSIENEENIVDGQVLVKLQEVNSESQIDPRTIELLESLHSNQ